MREKKLERNITDIRSCIYKLSRLNFHVMFTYNVTFYSTQLTQGCHMFSVDFKTFFPATDRVDENYQSFRSRKS